MNKSCQEHDHQEEKNEYVERKPKKRKRSKINLFEEKLLEDVVFNTSAFHLKAIDNVDLISVDLTKSISEDGDLANDLFIIDKGENQIEESKFTKSKSVWIDDDDDIEVSKGIQHLNQLPKSTALNDKYKEYLEKKFTSIYEPPSWATKALDNKKSHNLQLSDSEDDELVEKIAYDKIKIIDNDLDQNFLHIKKCNHLNISSRIKTSLKCINFHPNSTLALLGSEIGLVRLFQVDGKLNSIVQSIYFKGFRLSNAKFISVNGREEIIVGSDGLNPKCKGYCYYYDMLAGKIVRVRLSKGSKNQFSLRGFKISPNGQYIASCGDNGNINILTTNSKELIQEMKINGQTNCLAFSADSNYLVAHGQENGGQAFIFDIRNVRSSMPCVNRFNDLNSIVATAIDISNCGSFLATGSNSGVIDLFNFDDVLKQTNPIPLKSIMNLTTSITSLKFNHNGQLLLMASSQNKDAIRFFNTATKTVFKNFPSMGGKERTYGHIHDVDFSPNSGYASFVTGYGTGHLFRINHYSNY